METETNSGKTALESIGYELMVALPNSANAEYWARGFERLSIGAGKARFWATVYGWNGNESECPRYASTTEMQAAILRAKELATEVEDED